MRPEPIAFQRLRTQQHPHCVACSPDHPHGLRLAFAVAADGSVEARFTGGLDFEGYPGCLQGGVIAGLLDSAMTNCLFAHGCRAMTGELTVRFRHPAAADRVAIVRAWIQQPHPPLYLMRAELRQDARVVATASAKFMELPPSDRTPAP